MAGRSGNPGHAGIQAEEHSMTISPVAVDAAVIAAYFALIIGVGLWMSRGKKSLLAFALGNRQTPWWAVLASILAAEISAATFLGAPESGYSLGNWTYAQFAIGTVMARIIVSFVFIPVYYKHGVISLYEYLGTRFGPRTRHWASATFLLTRVLAMGTRLYVSAIIIVLAWQIWRGDGNHAVGKVLDIRRSGGAGDADDRQSIPRRVEFGR